MMWDLCPLRLPTPGTGLLLEFRCMWDIGQVVNDRNDWRQGDNWMCVEFAGS